MPGSGESLKMRGGALMSILGAGVGLDCLAGGPVHKARPLEGRARGHLEETGRELRLTAGGGPDHRPHWGQQGLALRVFGSGG